MFRGIIALMTVLSCLACAAFCAAWARTYWFADSVDLDSSEQSALVATMPGQVRICWPSPFMQVKPKSRGWLFSSVKRHSQSHVDLASSGFTRVSITLGGSAFTYVQFPFWALVAASGVLPVSRWSVATIRTLRRRRLGLCRSCGYDLRASPERCPECGAAPARPSLRTFPRMLAAGMVVITAGGLAWAAQSDFRSSDCVSLDFATLGGFPFDDDKGALTDIPPPIRGLDGHRVGVEGFMIPMDQAEQITCFALVPSLWGSRGPPPHVHEVIVVHIEGGRWIDYASNRIRVQGTLRVRVQTDEDGYVVSVYEMTADSVELVGPP